MKKKILTLSLLSILVITGCRNNETSSSSSNATSITQSSEEISQSEVSSVNSSYKETSIVSSNEVTSINNSSEVTSETSSSSSSEESISISSSLESSSISSSESESSLSSVESSSSSIQSTESSSSISSSEESSNSSSENSSVITPIKTNDLFISEYFNLTYKNGVYEAYNSNNDKALELYNPLDTSIDLSSYRIEIYSSGLSEVKSNDYIINLSGTLEAKKTYTIVNSIAREVLKEKADLLAKVYIGPKSAVGLYKNDVLIDVFGEIGKSYGSNMDFVINGVEGATDVHNIIRNPGYAANNTFTENEWEVRFDTNLSSLGNHNYDSSEDNNDEFDLELGKLALELLIEEYYDYNTTLFNGDIELIEEYEGFKFKCSVPYSTEYYTTDGKLIKAPEDGFYITIEVNLLDNNGNVVETSYGGGSYINL